MHRFLSVSAAAFVLAGLGVTAFAACSTVQAAPIDDPDTQEASTPGDDASGSSDSAIASDSAASEGGADASSDSADGASSSTFALTSTAFAEGGNIPAAQACNSNVSPPLAWSGAPAGTQSYALVMRDLSLVGMPNYHWVIYDIPASNTSLAQGIMAAAAPTTPAGAKETYWSFSADYSYLGPCPPTDGGAHDYQLTIYSFATATITVPDGTTDPAAADLVIQANRTGSATLSGKFAR
jgi:Raf kinase inhibitor-like YbhB/YbcL family protein